MPVFPIYDGAGLATATSNWQTQPRFLYDAFINPDEAFPC
jgi:hypothetical protein